MINTNLSEEEDLEIYCSQQCLTEQNYITAAVFSDTIVVGGGKMSYEAMDNKSFAYSILRKLLDVGRLDTTILTMLCDPDECKRLFCFSGKFAVLKEVSPMYTNEELDKVCYDGTKRQRYYKEVITVDGRAYVVCNHWYGPNKSMQDNRTPFQQWAECKF